MFNLEINHIKHHHQTKVRFHWTTRVCVMRSVNNMSIACKRANSMLCCVKVLLDFIFNAEWTSEHGVVLIANDTLTLEYSNLMARESFDKLGFFDDEIENVSQQQNRQPLSGSSSTSGAGVKN
jgi:hypothetical protein